MRVLIADDHALFREGLGLLLSKLFPSIVVLEAKDVDEVMTVLHRSTGTDLVLLDLMMPGMDGFRGLHRLKGEFPLIPMAILSMSEDLADIRSAIENGAAGYILKSADHRILEAAIALLAAGHPYVPPHALTALSGHASRSGAAARPRRPIDSLTPREKEVLAHLTAGHSNKVIANTLGVLEGTVKKHAHAIFQKLGVSNRTQAAMIASKQEKG